MPDNSQQISRHPGMGPDDFQCVADLLAAIPADEATVWLESGEDQSLTAVHNPVAAEIVGMRQPLDRGLISQVFVTGLPLLEADVTRRKAHDPTIDSLVGHRTLALMAAPIFSDADVKGVLSAVQMEDGHPHPELEPRHLAALEATARRLGETLKHSLPATGPE